jgi:hypothetical protein
MDLVVRPHVNENTLVGKRTYVWTFPNRDVVLWFCLRRIVGWYSAVDLCAPRFNHHVAIRRRLGCALTSGCNDE